MSLYAQLQKAESEEDVKDAYIKALGLKGHTKGLIDIQSKEIWFEAKHNGRHSSYVIFTQLLHYVQLALNKGETTPPFLAVLQPANPLSEAFKIDCPVWMLFNGGNLTASANNLEWNGKQWSIVNHFIPFTEKEVGAPDRFESDFMVQYLADKTLSAEARAVFLAGRTLWQAFFAHTDVRSVRDELKLNRPDVG